MVEHNKIKMNFHSRRMTVGYDLLHEIIENIGPIALFLVLCLGLIGLPIPNEAVAMTAGTLSEAGVMNSPLAYIMITLGICSAMTFNYLLGKFTSSTIGGWFSRKQKLGGFIEKSQQMTNKYGVYAIPISAFFPFLRHATPYVMGMNSMKYSKFIIFAFPTAAVWSGIYFALGHFVGDRIPEMINIINQYELIIVIVGGLLLALIIFRGFRKYKLKHANSK